MRNGGVALLKIACQNGYTEIVKALLETGAEINKPDIFEQTPLYIACQHGHTELVKLLLQNGADLNKADNYEQTPLFKACEGGHTELVELLLQQGAELNKVDNYKQTPLFKACEGGHTELVKLLLQKGADLNKADIYEQTPLYIACQNGHTDVVEALLEKGAEINTPNKNKQTPLFKACEGGHLGAVEALFNAGADVSIFKPSSFFTIPSSFFTIPWSFEDSKILKFDLSYATPEIKNLIKKITSPKAIEVRDQNLRQNNYNKENAELLKSYFNSLDPSTQVALGGNASEITPEIQSLTSEQNANQEVAKALLFLKFVAKEFSKKESALTNDERIGKMLGIYLIENAHSSFIKKMIDDVIENKDGLLVSLTTKNAKDLIELSKKPIELSDPSAGAELSIEQKLQNAIKKIITPQALTSLRSEGFQGRATIQR